jgi:hypothetical protein
MKKKIKVKVSEDGSISFEVPYLKPRNPNMPKGSQRHEDKRKKRKHKKSLTSEAEQV